MDLSKIPNRLRGKPYFCLMKLEQKTGKVKKDKVPYRTNGARADPTNPEHFTSLEKVMKVFDKGGYDGIGIGLFDDIIAIDIDQLQRTSDMRYIIETTKRMPEQGNFPLQRMWHRCFRQSLRTEYHPRSKRRLMVIVDSFSMMKMICHSWQCTGSTDSITWLAGTMTSTGCRCQTSLLMCADIPIVPIWQNRELIQRPCSTSWDIRIYRLR